MSNSDFRNDPYQWLAKSHPDLAIRNPEDLFGADFAEQYRRLHHDIYERMVRVDGTLYALEQLFAFPFDRICRPDEKVFWDLVIRNFLDVAVILLHGLVGDTGTDAHTLNSFKNQIFQAQWKSCDSKGLFRQTLKERKYDNAVEDIAERVKSVRDNWTAHRLIDKQTGSHKGALGEVAFEELQTLFEAAHSLLGALSFGSTYSTATLDRVGTVGGKPTRTSVDMVLDAVLRDNYFVNMPEHEGELWPICREHTSPDDLRLMNDLRERVELPPR